MAARFSGPGGNGSGPLAGVKRQRGILLPPDLNTVFTYNSSISVFLEKIEEDTSSGSAKMPSLGAGIPAKTASHVAVKPVSLHLLTMLSFLDI